MKLATPNAQRSTLNIQLESGGFPVWRASKNCRLHGCSVRCLSGECPGCAPKRHALGTAHTTVHCFPKYRWPGLL